jgi:Tol biopolymer transport system component
MVGSNLNGGLDHSWGPDGTPLAYRNVYTVPSGASYEQLVLRNVATGAERVLVDEGVSGLSIGYFEYAPDSTRIGFAYTSAYTVAVQTGALKLVAATSTAKNGDVTNYIHPVWSPDSSGLAITMYVNGKWGTTNDYVAKVPSTGGTVTNLTPKNTYYKHPTAWR